MLSTWSKLAPASGVILFKESIWWGESQSVEMEQESKICSRDLQVEQDLQQETPEMGITPSHGRSYKRVFCAMY